MIDPERDRQRLEYIADSIAKIERYTHGSKARFLRDSKTQDAVLRRLETLADAASKLPEQLKSRHPEIPWREVYRFRNIAAHAYEYVGIERVWEIVRDHLPPLKRAVTEELSRPREGA